MEGSLIAEQKGLPLEPFVDGKAPSRPVRLRRVAVLRFWLFKARETSRRLQGLLSSESPLM